ncbi:MAG: hypothetical protein IPH08_01970 [Rhodocyclaceae bacterium]|nr:hypothetical protein [Rhodocyclaceae bacterium]
MDSRTDRPSASAGCQANGQLRGEIVALKHQLDWFKRQLFGQRANAIDAAHGVQMNLGELFGAESRHHRSDQRHCRPPRPKAKPATGEESRRCSLTKRVFLSRSLRYQSRNWGLARPVQVISEKVSYRLAHVAQLSAR